MLRKWFRSGSPWIWLNAAAVSVSLIMVFGLLGLILFRGMGYFWPSDVQQLEYSEQSAPPQRLIGEIWDKEDVLTATLRDLGHDIGGGKISVVRYLLKTGNRDVYGTDFRLVLNPSILKRETPSNLMVLERREWGNFYGYLRDVRHDGNIVAAGDAARDELAKRLVTIRDTFDEIKSVEKGDIGAINYSMERLRLHGRHLEIKGQMTAEAKAEIASEQKQLEANYTVLQGRLAKLYEDVKHDSISVEVMDGRVVEVPLAKVIRAYWPNEMGLFAKLGMYLHNIWLFVSEDPREANTEGGVFPAIFGTVMMVLIMSVIVMPLGVIAALYLREYARQGFITRVIRIAVNNLAGVPSIVYGVFGLGFFVYFLGGNIDRLFFPEAFPAPTFGTPGILWSSLTLALLTLPVVIVATEEGLSRIPRAIREGSLALGATKFETLWRTVIPMASPAIMTGLILSVARAAGEVAPLMLVGVVKLAPSMPLDGNAPFIHLDRKFMHLGFHIYDVGFQSPNVEAARPLVYATALLLVVVIVVLNLAAISIRNRLREKYRALEN